jgi:HlyD family secretion protein
VEPAFPWPVVASALTVGRLERLSVQEGDRVKEGAVIAELYAKDIEDEVRRAEAELQLAKANLALLEAGTRKEEIAEARAKLKALEADLELRRKIADRSTRLSQEGAVSVEQAEKDAAAVATAAAEVEARKAQLDWKIAGPRKEEIDAARAEVERRNSILALAKKQLDYTKVRAPRDGVVYRQLVEQGERLTAEKPFVVSLYDPGSLWVRVDVAQADIGKVNLRQAVEVRTDAEPDRIFPGRIVRIDPRADFGKNTIPVRIALTEPKGRLHPDMTARVHFLTPGGAESGKPEVQKRILLIPRIGVVRKGGAAYVFEYREGVARRRSVELGGTLGDAVEVVSGLAPGARIIVSSLESLTDGAKVREKKEPQS